MTKPDTNNEEKKVISIYQIDAKLKNLNSIQKMRGKLFKKLYVIVNITQKKSFLKTIF